VNRSVRRAVIALLASALLVGLPAGGSREVIAGTSVYRCTDPSGTLLFTNRPSADASCELFMTSPAEAEANPPAASAPTVLPSESTRAVLLNNKGLQRFFDKLHLLQQGGLQKVTVFHIGDSHVRSDSFARTVAAGLQSEFGSLGGAFCFPVEKPKKKKAAKKPAAPPAQPPKPSITVTRRPIFPVKPVSATLAGAGNSCYTINALPESSDGTGIRYFSYGVNGKTFSWYAQQPALVTQLRNYQPDIVIVTLGTNDAFGKLSYESALEAIDSLVRVVLTAAPESEILLMSPPDAFMRGTSNPHIVTLQRAILDYADHNDLAAWDFLTAMGGTGSMTAWLRAGLARPDRIHFSSDGYVLMGEKLLTAILDNYRQYLAGSPAPSPAGPRVTAIY